MTVRAVQLFSIPVSDQDRARDFYVRVLGFADALGVTEASAALFGRAELRELDERTLESALAEIPRMGPDNQDKAARFVTMIDTFYERKVKFICSAAAAPEKLYTEGDGAFEFQRTVSRLMEMQSQEWLGMQHLT